MRDITLEDTFRHPFTTRAFATGVPTVLSGTPVLSVLEENNATPITSGVSVSVDRASVVGLNEATIVATAVNGYENGKSYAIYISTGTVGGVSVIGEIVENFTIGLSAAAVDLANGTDGLTALKTAIDDVPTTAEFEARTIVAASYFDPAADTVATVTTLTNKTGFSLASTGLDAIVSTATGMVEIAKAVWDRLLTGATHNISTSAGRRLRAIQDFGQYLGAVHIDTVNGTAGTVVDENGTADNPVLTLADAITLNNTLNFDTFLMSSGSSITLAQTFNNFLFSGRDGWTLALGGQDVGGTHFEDATVSGIGIGSTEITFEKCDLGTCTLNPFHANSCSLSATLTFGVAGNYLISNTHSRIAGMTTPIIDTGAAIANVNLAMPGYDRGIEIQNLNAVGTDEFSISGQGQIIYAASSSGNVEQSGDFRVTNIGGVTISEDDNTANIAATLVDTADIQPKIGAPATTVSGDIAALNDISVADILAGGDVDGFTVEGSLKLILASAAAKLSGAATTTVTIRAADDSKDRITATVDVDGNRSAVTLDATG